MGAADLLFITVSQSVSFIGKIWWTLMLVLRLLVLLLGGFTLFSDEQERFVCNTIQPGCSNVCINMFAPVSVYRLWLFHLVLLCLPHALFATYVMHKVVTASSFGGLFSERSRGGSPFENSSFSRELSLPKAPLHEVQRDWGVPRFYCSYILVVLVRMLLEVVFGAGQFFLFGWSIPKSFLCYEAPCTSGVECYISKPTEKTLMLNFMLGVAALSVLLSFFDLLSSAKAMVRWRRKREMLLEEMSKGEQSSVFTTTTTEDCDALLARRVSLSGSSKNGGRDEKQAAAVAPNDEAPHTKANSETSSRTAESNHDRRPESKEAKTDMSPPPVPSHFVHHSHLRPPMSPRPDRIPPPNPRVPTPMGVKKLGPQASANSGQQSDSSDSQDKRAWV
ncbi:gap junction delta-4 protein-like [Halichoeres trimaculatus]|uniref:gap junction delta-4 protein-like n=1 Tax=Halichoeres trimaculatus TaxID=147232 RepID=UPI003D9EFF91